MKTQIFSLVLLMAPSVLLAELPSVEKFRETLKDQPQPASVEAAPVRNWDYSSAICLGARCPYVTILRRKPFTMDYNKYAGSNGRKFGRINHEKYGYSYIEHEDTIGRAEVERAADGYMLRVTDSRYTFRGSIKEQTGPDSSVFTLFDGEGKEIASSGPVSSNDFKLVSPEGKIFAVFENDRHGLINGVKMTKAGGIDGMLVTLVGAMNGDAAHRRLKAEHRR